MRTALLAILLLLVGCTLCVTLSACTSSHRLVAIYESGEAVTGPVKVLEKAAYPANYSPAEETDEAKEDTSDGFLDSVRDLLP